MLCFSLFFFFKQKTAYEMRISDWSSDVCSSDLERFMASPRNLYEQFGQRVPVDLATLRPARWCVGRLDRDTRAEADDFGHGTASPRLRHYNRCTCTPDGSR